MATAIREGIGKTLINRAGVQISLSRRDLVDVLRGASIINKKLQITNLAMFKEHDLPRLAANVVDFGDKSAPENVKAFSSWVINEAAQLLGAKLNSPYEIYKAIAAGKETRKMSFPAVNIRGNSLETARALFRAAIDNNVGALIIEVARSEMGYTKQTPREFASVVLAAAMIEGFKGPVFLQGDHIQLKSKPFKEGTEADQQKELDAHHAIIHTLMERGFGSLDLDMSPFEERDKEDLTHEQQQTKNARLTAEKVRDVRLLESELNLPWKTLLGGETGEVGKKKNTSKEDIIAFGTGLQKYLKEMNIEEGTLKIAVNDGTSHGGVPLPGGGVAKVDLEFSVLKMAKEICPQFGWAGPVQHGASTLPAEAFFHFPENGAVEVHLATDFQNTLFDRGLYISKAKEGTMQGEVERFLVDKFRKEWKAKQTFSEFVYSNRKNAVGPFKYETWTMPEELREAVAEELYHKFCFLFEQLGVKDTTELVSQYVPDRNFHLPFPVETNAAGEELSTDGGTAD